jgi:hypothetical protein
MMSAIKYLLILFPYSFDGLTESKYIIKIINKINSVKTPSKLRQNEKMMTENRFLKKIF